MLLIMPNSCYSVRAKRSFCCSFHQALLVTICVVSWLRHAKQKTMSGREKGETKDNDLSGMFFGIAVPNLLL